MTEAAPVTVKPDQRLFWIFRRRPLLHGDEFFSDAHELKRLKQSVGDNLPNIFHSHGVPAVAQYPPSIRLLRDGKVLPSSKRCRVLLSLATTSPAIVSPCEFRPPA